MEYIIWNFKERKLKYTSNLEGPSLNKKEEFEDIVVKVDIDIGKGDSLDCGLFERKVL